MRVPMMIQGGFALMFLAVALPLHRQLADQVFDSYTLYWIFVVGIVAYAASYFARGWLAGHERFALFGGNPLERSPHNAGVFVLEDRLFIPVRRDDHRVGFQELTQHVGPLVEERPQHRLERLIRR